MDPPQRSKGLTKAQGLRSLPDLQKQVAMDSRRTGANTSLNKSMTAWMASKAEKLISQRDDRDDGEDTIMAQRDMRSSDISLIGSAQRSSTLTMAPRLSRITGTRLNLDEESINTLETAFQAHVAAFDMDGDNRCNVEELIIILERCRLFDEFFTPSKVRNHFSTWADGCNRACLTQPPLGDDGIGFQEFKFVIQWASDVKCIGLEECCTKVVRLSKKLCDKAASVQRRLEVVFDSFCKQDPTHMSAFEFGNLCRKTGVPFCMGDVFLIFSKHSGGLKEGIDFQSFISVLEEVGKKTGQGDEVFATFANAVELLDTDEETLIRIKMRLRQAAGIVGGADWVQFFHDCDADGSGTLDWDEFHAICRQKLHLADRDSHLRILFERLDVEATGEIAIDHMIEFITPGN